MLLSQDCLLKKKQTQNLKTIEMSAILQLLLLGYYTTAKVNLHTDISAEKYLNFKCSPVLSSNPVWHHEVWGRHTNLPLVLQEWKPFRDDSRQAYCSQLPQKDFWQCIFFTTRTLLFSPYCSTMSIPPSPLKTRNCSLQKFQYLIETRVFTKPVMVCVLLQETMVAKTAHQLGMLGGTE